MPAGIVCRDCGKGNLHSGITTGRIETIHGLPAYVTDSPNGQGEIKGIIIIIPDAFGWELPNTRILADKYAKRTNSRVYVPDFMDGHWLAHDMLDSLDNMLDSQQSFIWRIPSGLRAISGFIPFIYYNRFGISHPRVVTFMQALRANEAASLPVGVAGFCWGGKHVTLLCSDTAKTSEGKSLISCGFTAHPSALDIPTDIEAVKLPLSIAIGDVDFGLAIGMVQEAKSILEKDAEKHEVVIIPGAKHGFAVRGNPGNEEEVKQGIRAEDQAVAWYEKWFAAA